MIRKMSKFLVLAGIGLGLSILMAVVVVTPSWGLQPEKQNNIKPPSSLLRPDRSPLPLRPPVDRPSPNLPLLTPSTPQIPQEPLIPPPSNVPFNLAPDDEDELRDDRRNPKNAVIRWDNMALESIRNARPGPPVVARVLAMVHTAQYEAWSQYDPKAVGTLLGAKYRQPLEQNTEKNKTEAMSYAAYRVLVDLFPNFSRTFTRGMRELSLDINIMTTTPDTPAGIGNLAAAAVLAYRHNDGSNQLGDRHPGAYSDYTNYQPVNSPTQVNDLNYWQPLLTSNGSFQGGCVPGLGVPTLQTYVGPHWGLVIPFALDDGEAIAPSTPPARYPSPEFTQQAQEVLDISANLTDKQKAISEYWVDGPASELPPGHWALIAQLVSQRRRHTLDDDAKLFFAVSNANLDAGILAWKVKRTYHSVRPITAIREIFRGQKVRAWGGPGKGTELINGEDWEPYQDRCFVTPAFPEFISGHSTFSAASAEVLKSFTGSDNFPNIHTVHNLRLGNLQNPIKLQWRTFSEAADEAGISRRYGGIHFAQGDLVGRELGRKVGARVWAKAQRFFAGTAAPVNEMS
jgi:hypothetical protein